MDPRDLVILSIVQREFPLAKRPYDELSRLIGLSAPEIRRRLLALLKRGVVRRIAPMLDRGRLGIRGVLVAARVAPRSVARAAKLLDTRDEVTHNYLRSGPVNLWFTVSLGPGESAEPLIGELLALGGIRSAYVLPTRRGFKLDASFNVGAYGARRSARSAKAKPHVRRLEAKDRELLASLRAKFPTSASPWNAAALGRLRRLERSGILLGVRAALDQRKLGFRGNVLVAWNVPESRASAVGRSFALRPEASHVVLRAAAIDWPYNLYTMVHARTPAAARRVVREMAESARLDDYVQLVTRRELKKTAPRYF